MIIYPAIDLIEGAVVRLHKGDFDQLTHYGSDPVAVAKSYSAAGATWLHLVDLDGAKNPKIGRLTLLQRSLIAAVCRCRLAVVFVRATMWRR
jgi:phosphoribosylformimino-5-aminoimidazole carboxamide ribotide isomerase